MGFRFSIGRRIGTGFGVLLFFIVIGFYATYITLDSSIRSNDEITEVNNPSIASLESLKLLTVRSKLLIYTWADTKLTDHPDKDKLRRLIQQKYPQLKLKISKLSVAWTVADIEKIKKVFSDMIALFEMHEDVMSILPDFDSYNDTQNLFMAEFYLGDDGDIHIATDNILFLIDDLIEHQKFQTNQATSEMQSSFAGLKLLTIALGVLLVVGGFLIAVFTTRSIVTPIGKLKKVLLTLSKGVFPAKSIEERNDEIGEMTNALNRVVLGLKGTKDFANAVGSGSFDANYEPLSDEDTLGLALMKMRDDLAENERVLEQKVVERTAALVEKQVEVEHQNKKISELYEEVTDSIKYAKGLQEAILPPKEFVNEVFPNSFILYKPKDIVSGDFYWIEKKNNKVYFAAVDCTGHGVPGAFMSIVGYNALNEALRQFDSPAEILDALNLGISKTLHNNAIGSTTKDGMDLALCCYDAEKNQIEYAGAYNPLYLLRNKEITQVKADKFAIGSYFEDENKKYTNHVIALQKDDHVYIFSDGYADQFGGAKGKKFMYKRFRDLLISNSSENMLLQKQLLDSSLQNWKGSLEQVDDILVVGFHNV